MLNSLLSLVFLALASVQRGEAQGQIFVRLIDEQVKRETPYDLSVPGKEDDWNSVSKTRLLNEIDQDDIEIETKCTGGWSDDCGIKQCDAYINGRKCDGCYLCTGLWEEWAYDCSNLACGRESRYSCNYGHNGPSCPVAAPPPTKPSRSSPSLPTRPSRSSPSPPTRPSRSSPSPPTPSQSTACTVHDRLGIILDCNSCFYCSYGNYDTQYDCSNLYCGVNSVRNVFRRRWKALQITKQ